jgi:predicted ABC-type ATPase
MRVFMSASVYIIAGPNGAGKTTFAREFLPNYADCKNFINADLIAQGVSPFSPEAVAFHAGRLLLRSCQVCITQATVQQTRFRKNRISCARLSATN